MESVGAAELQLTAAAPILTKCQKKAAAEKKRHGSRDDRAVQRVCLRRRRRPRRWLPLQEGRIRSRGRRRRSVFLRAARCHLRRPPLGDLVASTGMRHRIPKSYLLVLVRVVSIKLY